MSGTTLDAGALFALERGDERVRMLIRQATLQRIRIAIPTGVVAQAWRDGRRQAQLARLIHASNTEIVALDLRPPTGVAGWRDLRA
ncbi:MAG: hypothetical protein J2P24_08775 [Streptosporangiales bacterium]|nr:hypothetical protein [Streptosporangiales bacterium]MBO0891175.1 hypothetical protein [Acidothermales bacterium]